MALTLKDAQKHVYRDVNGGSCEDAPLVTDRINQAIGFLLKQQYAVGEFGEWLVRPRGNLLLLPPEIETAELITAYGSPVPIQAQWYRYMRHRVSCSLFRSCIPLAVHDLGDGYVSDVTLSTPQMVIAYSHRPAHLMPAETTGLQIYVQGKDENGQSVYTHKEGKSVDGVYLDINDTRPRMSEWEGRSIKFSEIRHVWKPETLWPVTLATYIPPEDPTDLDDAAWLTPVCTLLPWETSVSRRLYQFEGSAPDVVSVFGRARYRPAKAPHEPLLIQDLEAIRQAVFKIEAEANGNTAVANYHKREAQESLDKTLDRSNGATQTPLDISPQLPEGYGLGWGIQTL